MRIEEAIELEKIKWTDHLPDAMNNGILRFRKAKDEYTPSDFCWDAGYTHIPPPHAYLMPISLIYSFLS
jgi:hypothetical protein